MNSFFRYFLFVVAAALASSVLGGAFASVVAVVSPEFVKGLFSTPEGISVPRYAAGAGMIWGLFLGTAVMGFSLFVATLSRLAKALEARKVGESQK